MKELVTTTASLTTAVKNVYDISSNLIVMRKQNKLISAGQLRQLGVAISRVIEEERMAGMHSLMTKGRDLLVDSFKQIQDYANTDFGDMLLETIREEARYFKGYWDDYDHFTKPGGFR